MKIWKIASPLPFNTIPSMKGEISVDSLLSEQDIMDLDEKYGFKNHIGGGMWGIAFSTFDDKVVKITTDGSEYISALDLAGDSWQKYAPFARVYEAYQLSEGLFVIVKDLVIPLDEGERELFYEFISKFNLDIDQVTDEYKDKMSLFEEFDDYSNDVQNYTQFEDTFNSDNIGRDSDGKMVAFDPRQPASI